MLAAAKAKADEMGLSLSTYVNQLVRKDLGLTSIYSVQEASEAHGDDEPEPPAAPYVDKHGKRDTSKHTKSPRSSRKAI